MGISDQDSIIVIITVMVNMTMVTVMVTAMVTHMVVTIIMENEIQRPRKKVQLGLSKKLKSVGEALGMKKCVKFNVPGLLSPVVCFLTGLLIKLFVIQLQIN